MYAMMAKNTTARSRFTGVPAETFRIRKRRGGRTGWCARFSATTNPGNKGALPAKHDDSPPSLGRKHVAGDGDRGGDEGPESESLDRAEQDELHDALGCARQDGTCHEHDHAE